MKFWIIYVLISKVSRNFTALAFELSIHKWFMVAADEAKSIISSDTSGDIIKFEKEKIFIFYSN